MSDLITCTLEDICLKEKGSIISGPFGSNISSKYFVSSGIPVIRGNNLTTDHIKFIDDGFVYVTEEKANELHCDAYADDLIFTAAGTIGQVGIIPKNTKYNRYVISNKQIRVRLDTELVDLDYAYCWFVSPWIQTALKNNNKGSTVPLLTLAEVRSLPITYPKDKGEQKAIAKVFNDLDAKIDNNVAICSDLEAIAKLLYDYWFVQFDFPDENGKPYKSSGGKMVWNEELKREIPDGWEVKRLGTLIDHNRGISYTGKSFSKDGTPIISLASIDRSGRYIPDGIKYYNQEYAHSKVVKPFDLVMANTDMTQERAVMGKIIFVPDIFDGDILTTHHITQIHTDELLKAYLMMTTQTDWFHNYIKGFSSGTNVLGMDMMGFEDYLLIIPEKTILRRFNEVIYGIYNRIFSNIRENQELASLRDFLLPMLMNGQVKVKKEDTNE